ncbi:MAG: hypothetical protein IJS04_05155, partial [Muribaculaceae bacterium]|nr:hypothetical protein [Muribaculaceae bacterium]
MQQNLQNHQAVRNAWPHIILSMLLLLLSLPNHAQHTMGNSMNATMQAMPVTPQRPLEPGAIDTAIYQIDFCEEYMPDPFPPPGNPSPVGTVPYDIIRSNNGRFNLNIPIESFASEFESSHGISLTYQGGVRTTMMGRGWNLTGASVISRCGRDFFTDGNTTPVSLDDDTAWSLDGARLILQETAGGVRRYRTQVGNTLALQDGNGNFTVLYPDGSKSYYGERDSLRHYVTRHVALDGKEINYTYSNSHFGYRLLTSVSYGDGRQLALHYRRMYGSVDPEYVAGVPIERRHLLDSLFVVKEGKTLATYVVAYQQKIESEVQPSMICRLDSSGQHHFKALKFAYHGNAEQRFDKTYKSLARMLQVEDYDMSKLILGRGRFDSASEDEGFFLFPNRQGYDYVIGQYPNSHYESRYNTADSIIVTTDMHHNGHDIPCAVVGVDTCFVEALAMDVDGSSSDELVRVNNQVLGGLDVTTFAVYVNAGSAMQLLDNWTLSMPALTINAHKSVRPKTFLPGDFDGDGRADLLVLSYSDPPPCHTSGRIDLMDLMNGTSKASFSIDSCFMKCFSWDDPLMTDNEKWLCFNLSDRVLVMDHDGDGKKELGVINEHGFFIYSFKYNPAGNLIMQKTQADCPVTLSDFEYLDVIPCDLNGDGNTDLTTARMKPAIGNGDTGRITMMSDGTGKFAINIYQASAGAYDGQVALTDYNRDGCTDIYYNGGYGDASLGLPANRYLIGGNVFDGRLAPLAALGPNGTITLFHYDSPVDAACTLASVQDGSGKEHVFTHGRFFLNYDNSYANQSYEYPFRPVAEGMLVNTREVLHVDGTVVSDMRYQYSAPTFHQQGLGFLGFMNVQRNDNVTGKQFVETYSAEHLGSLFYKETPLEEKILTLNKSVGADGHISVTVLQDRTNNPATGVTATTAYTHDTYGNVLSATTTYPGDIVKTVTNEYDNITTGGAWLIGLERRHTESVTRGGSTLTDGRTTTYNSDWLPDTVITWRGSEHTPVLTRTVRYDGKRPDRIKTRAYNGDALIRHIGYYAGTRLPQFVSDEHGMRTTYVYGDFGVTQSSLTPEIGSWADDYEYPVIPIEGPIGNLSGGNELNGGGQVGIDPPSNVSMYPILDTYYHYDSFGRQDSVTAPDGSVKAVLLAWTTDVPGARYMTEQTETNRPTTRTWHDALGRKVRQGIQRANGTWTYVLYEYNTLGQLLRESMPTTTGNAAGWTTYTYDDTFDSLTEKEYPDGHSDTYTYNGLTTTSVIDGVATTRTVDALGNLVSVTDGGGTLQYTLRPDGQPSEIRAPGDIATTFTYDAYGRRVSITDPSAGTRTTTYDANGHVASETDANQKTVTSTYTIDGKLTGRTFGDGLSVTYSYNLWNNPTQMLGSDGHGKSWGYNDLQQLTSETVDGFTKTYTYDHNIVSSVAYSKDNAYICAENYSRMNGHLTSVTLHTGDTLWALRSQNPRMLPTKVGLGHLVQTLSYDVRGNVTERKVKDRDNAEIQWLGYQYATATGNMTGRDDWMNFTSESMDYDGLNRLTDIEQYDYMSGYRYQSTGYDGKGNITSHSTSGQYGYGTARPYAFNELMSPSPLIPQRDQHISFNA